MFQVIHTLLGCIFGVCVGYFSKWWWCSWLMLWGSFWFAIWLWWYNIEEDCSWFETIMNELIWYLCKCNGCFVFRWSLLVVTEIGPCMVFCMQFLFIFLIFRFFIVWFELLISLLLWSLKSLSSLFVLVFSAYWRTAIV